MLARPPNADEIALPSLQIKCPPPLNDRVDIDSSPTKGTIEVARGMNMLKWAVVVD